MFSAFATKWEFGVGKRPLSGTQLDVPNVQFWAVTRGSNAQIAGVLWTCSIFPPFARCASAGPSYPQSAAAMATNSHPTTSYPRNGVPAGAAADAGPIVPLPGVADGRPRLSAQVTSVGVAPPAREWRNGEGARGIHRRHRTGLHWR
jgi:hypothetical protein